MSVEAAEHYLPQSDRMADAYQAINTRHFLIGSTLEELKSQPIERLEMPVSDYISAGISFLANRVKDPQLEKVGTDAFLSMNRQQTRIGFTNSIPGAMVQLGFPNQAIRQGLDKPGEVFFTVLQDAGTRRLSGLVLVPVPVEFIYKARTSPIEALASTAWFSSQIRDLFQGRIPGDTRVTERANEIEAHFLHYAITHDPLIKIGPVYRRLMDIYPKGHVSLDLDR